MVAVPLVPAGVLAVVAVLAGIVLDGCTTHVYGEDESGIILEVTCNVTKKQWCDTDGCLG